MRRVIVHLLTGIALTSVVAACAPSQPARDPAKPYDPSTMEAPPGNRDPQAAALDPSQLPGPPVAEPEPAPEPQRSLSGPVPISRPTDTQDYSAAKVEKALSDKEILTVAIAANEGEVQMAVFARKKASSDEVKEFAGMMLTHHSTGLSRKRALQGRAKLLVVDENNLSLQLRNDVATAIANLRDKDGTEFDRLYVEAQVSAHKDVLDALDHRMLNAARNYELKTLLTEMRRQVAEDLEKAEDLQKKLDGGAVTSAWRSG